MTTLANFNSCTSYKPSRRLPKSSQKGIEARARAEPNITIDVKKVLQCLESENELGCSLAKTLVKGIYAYHSTTRARGGGVAI